MLRNGPCNPRLFLKEGYYFMFHTNISASVNMTKRNFIQRKGHWSIKLTWLGACWSIKEALLLKSVTERFSFVVLVFVECQRMS